jgi:hypothetical protein
MSILKRLQPILSHPLFFLNLIAPSSCLLTNTKSWSLMLWNTKIDIFIRYYLAFVIQINKRAIKEFKKENPERPNKIYSRLEINVGPLISTYIFKTCTFTLFNKAVEPGKKSKINKRRAYFYYGV